MSLDSSVPRESQGFQDSQELRVREATTGHQERVKEETLDLLDQRVHKERLVYPVPKGQRGRLEIKETWGLLDRRGPLGRKETKEPLKSSTTMETFRRLYRRLPLLQ